MGVGKFSKILVAIDGSEMSMKAAECAITMAKKDNANLVVVNIIYTPASTLVYNNKKWFNESLKKLKVKRQSGSIKLKKMLPKMK